MWITFPEKQPVEVTCQLSQLGFHWNNLRQAWQHPCGTMPADRKNYDPRSRYGYDGYGQSNGYYDNYGYYRR